MTNNWTGTNITQTGTYALIFNPQMSLKAYTVLPPYPTNSPLPGNDSDIPTPN